MAKFRGFDDDDGEIENDRRNKGRDRNHQRRGGSVKEVDWDRQAIAEMQKDRQRKEYR